MGNVYVLDLELSLAQSAAGQVINMSSRISTIIFFPMNLEEHAC